MSRRIWLRNTIINTIKNTKKYKSENMFGVWNRETWYLFAEFDVNNIHNSYHKGENVISCESITSAKHNHKTINKPRSMRSRGIKNIEKHENKWNQEHQEAWDEDEIPRRKKPRFLPIASELCSPLDHRSYLIYGIVWQRR